MEFTPGQIVVHPHHGPSTVAGFTSRMIRDREFRYIQLETHEGGLGVSVPCDRADEVGLRPLLGGAAVREVFEALAGESSVLEKQWSRRMKALHELVRTGRPTVLAGVVRDLTRRQAQQALSTGEKDLAQQARTPLAAELALCLHRPAEEVGAMIDAAVLDRVVPEPTVIPLALAG